MRGKGKLPVADYTLAVNILDSLMGEGESGGGSSKGNSSKGNSSSKTNSSSKGSKPAPQQQAGTGEGEHQSQIAAAAEGAEGVVDASEEGSRGVYSFCMCPGAASGLHGAVRFAWRCSFCMALLFAWRCSLHGAALFAWHCSLHGAALCMALLFA